MAAALSDALARYRDRVDTALNKHLPAASIHPQRLHEAMRYAVFNGGKRIRPVLAYATTAALGGDVGRTDAAACAVELIHAYSLVHDDLPAMDNDDLRRGKPTCHRAFDEATAMLVGDGLQALAFQILADADKSPVGAQARLDMVETLARAAGSRGMVGGQVVDIQSEGKEVDLETVQFIHARKTGALIRVAVTAGAILGGGHAEQVAAIRTYGREIGLAFQIADDILDIEGDTAVLGKAVGGDARKKKITYPSVLGLQRSKQIQAEVIGRAVSALDRFDHGADPLRSIAKYIIERKK